MNLHSDVPFPLTRWSLIAGTRATDDPAKREAALRELCSLYWPPVYGFLRRRGLPPEDAQDGVQGFMLSLLQEDLFAKADSEGGRLRSFLLGALQRWQRGEWRKAVAEKRGGGRVIVSLDALQEAEAGYDPEDTSGETPERYFEKKCALILLDTALQRLAAEQQAAGKGQVFEVIRPLLAPVENAPAITYEEAAAALHMTGEALRVTLHRLRKRFATVLRETIADTLTEPTEENIAAELAALKAAWSS